MVKGVVKATPFLFYIYPTYIQNTHFVDNFVNNFSEKVVVYIKMFCIFAVYKTIYLKL